MFPSGEVTTPLYEAPELLNNGEYTTKVDVFSFAVVLYEILGGIIDDSWDYIKKVIKGTQATFPDSINDEMKSLISRCWSQNPNGRPSFAEILSELKQIKFKILPDVDSVRVREFLSDVESKRAQRFSNSWPSRETGLIFKRTINRNLLDHQHLGMSSETRTGPGLSFQ
jgi:serine/threonine protein kinase